MLDRGRLRSHGRAAPAVVFVAALVGLVGASAATAVPGMTVVAFTSAGCQSWSVPAGVSSVQIQAIGAAGGAGDADGSPAADGGAGDAVPGALSGLTGGSQSLFVCVDQGGGSGGDNSYSANAGGDGGGASGVSLGSDFSAPVLVAGGGGGGGADEFGSGGAGGSAGEPVAQAGFADPGDANAQGGGGGTNVTGGAGGGGDAGTGGRGVGSSASGPGTGGTGATNGGSEQAGGGGGGGYFGGGGGGVDSATGGISEVAEWAGGGGGGSDFCADGYSGGTSISCGSVVPGAGTQTVAGSATGDAEVTLTYTTPSPPPTVTITTPPNGASYTYGQVVDAEYSCSAGAGATLKSCVGPVADGSPIDTSTVGPGQSLEVTATDTDNQTTSVTNTYTVTAAATSLTASPQVDLAAPRSAVGLDVASATLTSGGTALSGQTITFTDGSLFLCTAVTTSKGIARCSIPPKDEVWVLLNNHYTATYTATTDYTGATATTPAVLL